MNEYNKLYIHSFMMVEMMMKMESKQSYLN